MKTSEKARILDVLVGLSRLGKVDMRASSEAVSMEVYAVRDWREVPESQRPEVATLLGSASMFVAGPYAGEAISATGDAVIAVVNKSFPALKFMSDAERARN